MNRRRRACLLAPAFAFVALFAGCAPAPTRLHFLIVDRDGRTPLAQTQVQWFDTPRRELDSFVGYTGPDGLVTAEQLRNHDVIEFRKWGYLSEYIRLRPGGVEVVWVHCNVLGLLFLKQLWTYEVAKKIPCRTDGTVIIPLESNAATTLPAITQSK